MQNNKRITKGQHNYDGESQQGGKSCQSRIHFDRWVSDRAVTRAV